MSLSGVSAPDGTSVSAWWNGTQLAGTETRAEGGEARYRLDLPGDDPVTAAVEGPDGGQSVELRVEGRLAASVVWISGVYQRRDLATTAGADLLVSVSDGVSRVDAGALVPVTLTVTNDGPGTAEGSSIALSLPPGSLVESASDGGSETNGVVRWPAVAVSEGASVVRTAGIRLAPSFAAGLSSVTFAATAEHDGGQGPDPDPADNSAFDLDQLDAAPDLAVSVADGRAVVRPGETLFYRVVASITGSQGATGVVMTFSPPPGTEYYSSSHGGAISGTQVSWPVSALAVGATEERTVTLRVPVTLGAEVTSLTATASIRDDGSNGPDPASTNDSDSDLDAVERLADLQVEGVDSSFVGSDPQTLSLNGSVSVAFANRGALVAGPFDLVLFLDRDGDEQWDAGEPELGRESLSGLASNASESRTIPIAGTEEFRDERIFAFVDAGQVVTELDEANNIADSAAHCLPPTAPSAFEPAVERKWPPAGGPSRFARAVDSISTPLVVQLTDDNGDGKWDDRDIADIVFVSVDLNYTLEPEIVLRAIRGDTGASLWDVNGFFPGPLDTTTFFSLSGLAAGDIDNDGKPEILSTLHPGDNVIQAYEHDGRFKWKSASYRTHPTPGVPTSRDNPTIADLDGDGFAEIVVGANVFDRAGRLKWRGTGGQAFQAANNLGDFRSGAISVAADVDLDGRLEVVTGNTLYRHDGSIVWQLPMSDGYPAVANFDADPNPEIAVVSRGTVRLHDANGSLIWGPVALPGSDPEAGGPPTIGDFDGDGAPEIGVAGSDVYVVLETNGSLRWQASTRDYTSNTSGSTIFDFDGDGQTEVVYRDEQKLRIYRGTDGVVLYSLAMSSDTWTEEPVVADVDGDGNAEIVVSSDRAYSVPSSGVRTNGIFVIGDPLDRWVGARPIWNQHAYTPEMVEDDAGIPRNPEWSWLSHNSFRANVAPSGGAFASPDLTASRVVIDLTELPRLRATVRIGNAGLASVAPGAKVAFYSGATATPAALLGVVTLPDLLRAGEFVDAVGEFDLPLGAAPQLTVMADDDGTGTGRDRECDEANNMVTRTYDPTALGLWVTLDDGTTAVGAADLLTYTIRVANSFAASATGVQLVDELPAELEFLSASDGGALVDGRVEWPMFTIAPGTVAIRTVDVRVDPALPLAAITVTNRVTATDDGANGADSTSGNNTATDVDQVVTATAVVGGPYEGVEGTAIVFDGSASFDRNGTIVAWEWDLDGDGEFDDASGVRVEQVYPDDGAFLAVLRVRDDSGESDTDRASITVANAAPAIAAPVSLESDEGGIVSLAGLSVTDPGVGDLVTARIDWGDGATEVVASIHGAVPSSHLYSEDGDYPVSVCVTDGDGGESCATIDTRILNVAPEVHQTTTFDLEGWTAEELPGSSTINWSVDSNGAVAKELANGRPSFLVGDLPAFGTYEFSLRVAKAADDDFFGFALGFQRGDAASSSADYLLIDWKQGDQSGARRGLALSRVSGSPAEGEFWLHADFDSNGSSHRVLELQRARTLGSKGWNDYSTYLFKVELHPSRLRVWVNGSPEFDLSGSFPSGNLAFYNYSQANTTYVPIGTSLFVNGFEGGDARLGARFSDPGMLDLHTATISWGDATTSAGDVSEEEGAGAVVATHVYEDEGIYSAELCVADDEGEEGCASIPASIENVAPTLNLQLSTTGFVESSVSLVGTSFTDPGRNDVHVATIDWGDGTIETATVSESSGSGTVAASHLYAVPGSFQVRLCVDDDDGGLTCSERGLVLVRRSLDLVLTKSATVETIRPSQQFAFTLSLTNAGTLPASGIVLTDALPPELTFVSLTGTGSFSNGVATWNLANLAAGATSNVTLTVRAAATLPFGGSTVNTASATDDGASGPDGNPADNQSSWSLRFSDAVTPIVTVPGSVAGVEGTALTLNGVAFADTTSTEGHTATVSWGDGATNAVALTVAAGTSGQLTGTGRVHTYLDDGNYTIEVCVRDAAANLGCAATEAIVTNSDPTVIEPGPINFNSWRSETFAWLYPANWSRTDGGLTVTQLNNSDPTFFYSPARGDATVVEGFITVLTEIDNDFIGLALGFEPGDTTNPEAEYLILDWKQTDQSLGSQGCGTVNGLRGIALSRVQGVPSGLELWGHRDLACNGSDNAVIELARGKTLARTGWGIFPTEYKLKVQYESHRVQVWVNNVLQIDVAGTFPTGPWAFYGHSQQGVRYRGFLEGLASQPEGEPFNLSAGFTDLGRIDNHSATVDWDDGATLNAEASTANGVGSADATHDYLDNGLFAVETCVTDDDGGSDCGRFPLLVFNVAPTVVAGADTTASAGLARIYDLGTFTDPGRLDSHSATVDWGDGAVEAGVVLSDDGRGSVSGEHIYATAGVRTVKVCVVDDDGGEGCDTMSVSVGAQLPVLTATKTVTPIDRDGDGRVTPGDDLLWEIVLTNVGGSAATNVTVTDPAPGHTTLQAASVVPDTLATSFDPLTFSVGRLDPGDSIALRFVTAIDPVLPADVREIVNSGTVTSTEFGPIATDDPALPGAADPTRIGVETEVRLRVEKTVSLVDLDGNGFATEGDEIAWTIVATNSGDTEAAGVLVRDSVPAPSALVVDSLVASTGMVTRLDPIELVVDRIGAGETVTIDFRSKLPDVIDRVVTSTSNQAELSAGSETAIRSDDPATAELSDPTTVAIAPIPNVSVEAASVLEGHAGTTPLRFRLSLDVATAFPVTVTWSTADASAIAGDDYEAAAGIATFEAGATEAWVDVLVRGDLVVEANETLALVLSDPHWARIVAGEALGTITNDDATELSIEGASVEEGGTLRFVVRLSQPSALPVTFDGATADGTATAPADYAPFGARIELAPFETERELLIATEDDDESEDDETLSLVLSNAPGASITITEATGTIVDNDASNLSVTKGVVLEADVDQDGAADRGDTVRYTLVVENVSRGRAREVVLRDALPAELAIEAGSVTTSRGSVLSESPLEVAIGTLVSGERATIELLARLDPSLSPQPFTLPNQATVTVRGGLSFPSDDPSTPEPLDPTVVHVPGLPVVTATKVATLALDADGNAVASPGDELEYILVVANIGGAEATAVTLRDLVPSSTAVAPGSVATDVGVVTSESPIEVAIGTLAAGQTATVRFRIAVAPVVPAGYRQLVNQGFVSSTELPVVPTDDPSTEAPADPTVTLLVAAPRLVTTKSDALAVDADGDGTASPGDTLEYTIAVENLGNTSATEVVLTDPIPDSTSIEPGSVVASQGVVVTEEPLAVELGEIVGREAAQVRFRVVIDDPIAPRVREVANQALVASAELPNVASDDPATEAPADPTKTPVVAAPILELTKRDALFTDAANDGVASPGDVLLYRLVLGNRGNTAATDVVIEDPHDSDTLIEAGSVQTSRGTVESESPLRIAVGELPAGAMVEVTYLARIRQPFPITRLAVANQATASSWELSPIPGDDPDSDPGGDPTTTEVYIRPSLAAVDAAAPESAGTLVFRLDLSEPSNRPVELAIATGDGSARAPADYGTSAAIASIAPGATTANVAVPIVDDLVHEADEQLGLLLSSISGAILVDEFAVGTIVDDDPAPTLSIGDASVDEGDAGLVDLVFPLTLSAPSGVPAELRYATAPGSATVDVDYLSFVGHLAIATGETASSIRIQVVGDLSDELDETFTVSLSNPVDVGLPDAGAIGTVLDDDLAQLSIDDVSTVEGDSGTKTVEFTVSSAGPAAEEVHFDFVTEQDTATEGFDYLAASGSGTIPAGSSEATIPVEVVGDTWFEEDERFHVRLSNGVAAELADDLGIGTIRNDEGCAGANLVVNGGAEIVGPDGSLFGWTEVVGDWKPRWGNPVAASGKAFFDAPSDLVAELDQTVPFTAFSRWLTNGSVELLASGFVRLAATGGRAQVELELYAGNGSFLGAEPIGIATSALAWQPFEVAVDVPAGTAWARLRLVGDGFFDHLALRVLDVPTVTISDASVDEPDSGAALLPFVATLSCPIEPTLRFHVATANGTATAPADYLSRAQLVSIARGELETSLPVSAVGDLQPEGAETMYLDVVSGPSVPWVALLDGRGVGTIVDGDFCRRTIGYWKAHPEAWPLTSMRLGAEQIDVPTMNAYLAYTGGNIPSRLAQQLVATKLNLAKGSPRSIVPTVEAADAYLVTYPPGTSVSGAARTQGDTLKTALDVDNNGCKANE